MREPERSLTRSSRMRGSSLAPAACALLATLGVGGCDGGDSDDSDATDRPPTPSAASSPPSGPTTPASAAEPDADGARAYVDYYVDVVNYAADSGDTRRLHDEASECGYCQQFAAVYDNIYDNGGSFDGKPYTLSGVKVTEQSSKVRAVATVKSRTGATFQIAEDARRRNPDAQTFTWTFELRRTGDSWQIVGMDESF